MRTSLILSVLGLACFAALGGCSGGGGNSDARAPVAAAVLPHASHDPIAAYNQYRTTSQLAEGLYDAGIAVGEVHDYFDIRGKLPTSAAMAESVESRDVDQLREAILAGRYVEDAAIGPAPGVVTVTWGGGELAGKSLVLLPRLGNRLCFRVDTASTTVPAETLAHANIAGQCQVGE